MEAKERALRKVRSLIARAVKERDTKGYRENLGYDSIHALDNFLSPLDLSYTDKCEVRQVFWQECDKI